MRRGVHREDVAYSRLRAGPGKAQERFDRPGKGGVNEPAMYDTSDIRKGLKVLMDGNPYTVIEFQFVKPGGAAFTRTKFKNLLTGAVVERNIRSGEKLEPANVETRDMQFLYKEGNDLVFMDQSNYEQVTISKDLIGDAHDLMKDNLPCTVVFFNERPVDVTLPTFVFLEVTASEPGVQAATRAATCRSRRRSKPAPRFPCRCSSGSATRSRSTRARTRTSNA